MRLTFHGLYLLTSLDNSTEPLAGADLMRMMDMRSGSLYPILKRLEDQGYVTGQWEDGTPRELQRPLRKLYSLTPEGRTLVRNTVAMLSKRNFR